MESEASATDLVARLDPEVDRIPGLITVMVRGGEVLALVTSPSAAPMVRQELMSLGAPEEMLDLEVVDRAMIAYPVTDERLRRWLEEGDDSAAIDPAVTVKGPKASITPRTIVKWALIGVVVAMVALSLLSMVLFLLLMLLDSWLGGGQG